MWKIFTKSPINLRQDKNKDIMVLQQRFILFLNLWSNWWWQNINYMTQWLPYRWKDVYSLYRPHTIQNTPVSITTNKPLSMNSACCNIKVWCYLYTAKLATAFLSWVIQRDPSDGLMLLKSFNCYSCSFNLSINSSKHLFTKLTG